ncbi:phosphomethylpyrimidine kinase [Pseudoramibacter alactolyticus ATCC 23263]|uniref:pyridoxal kinase n=1 Tax=Pseudoramibacter alactolyticus ATCC 23263 TaxID=887929 RepID=E6MIB3_9FIRM|nr:pyridoxamine kinase [Pseudoramibacter alactolyticus]EFV01009.1 phosphomethylpyrimidine kinase [Pseudoramibacter alactolyticus ATCC 23263]
MKRVLTIQDISCFGKCSLTVALPVISAMGVETAVIPTAVLSTHTMFKNFTVKDLTDQIVPITEHWRAEGIGFDAVYTGYLGSFEQIEIVEKLFDDFADSDTLRFIDPVMADNGKLYPAFDEAYAARNAELCRHADFIVPNITEACFMTGTDYRETTDEAYIKNLLEKLGALGPKTAVLTGVSLSPGKTGVMGIDTVSGTFYTYQNDRIDATYHGTGDLFSSTCVGAMMNGIDWQTAMQIAADYTARTIAVTVANPANPWYGVDFETTIPELIRMLDARR